MKGILLAGLLAGVMHVSAQEKPPQRAFILKQFLEDLDATHRRAIIFDLDNHEELTVILTPDDIRVTPEGIMIVRPTIVGPEL